MPRKPKLISLKEKVANNSATFTGKENELKLLMWQIFHHHFLNIEMLSIFTWLGLSRSGGESLPPTILLLGNSISQTPVASMSADQNYKHKESGKLENIQTQHDLSTDSWAIFNQIYLFTTTPCGNPGSLCVLNRYAK